MAIQIKELNSREQIDDLLPLFEAYRRFYRKDPSKFSLPFLVERFRNRESVVYLAYDSSKAVGFVQLFRSFSSTRLASLWILNDLYTLQEYRNQAIGKQLIERCKQLCLDSGSVGIILETEKNNLPGNHLYPLVGFKLMDEVNHYFWRNPDQGTSN